MNLGEQSLGGQPDRSHQSASVPDDQHGSFTSGANRTTLDGEDHGSAATIEQLIQITKALQTDNEVLRRQMASSTVSTTQPREPTPTWADITSRGGKSDHVMDKKNKNRTVSKLKQEISKQEEGDFTQIMRSAAKQHAGQGSAKHKNTVSIKQMSVMTIQMEATHELETNRTELISQVTKEMNELSTEFYKQVEIHREKWVNDMATTLSSTTPTIHLGTGAPRRLHGDT